MAELIAGIRLPDSRIAKTAIEFVRDCEPEFLFNHSMRVFLFGTLRGRSLGLRYDDQLLFVAALFHDLGLMDQHSSPNERFEVDGANAAREFLQSHGLLEDKCRIVWEAIALHTTPGIPQHMCPEIALTRSGVITDVGGSDIGAFTIEQKDAVLNAYPRDQFKQRFISAQAKSACGKPHTTFGTINSDYITWVDPTFRHPNLCRRILDSPWHD